MVDTHNFNNICEIIDIIESVKAGNHPADFNRSCDTLETYLYKKYIILIKSDMDDISWEQHLGI